MGFLKALAGGYLGWLAFKNFLSKASLPAATTQSFEEICLRAGYPVETHIVRTEDGYFLRLFRLTKKGKPFSSADKKPVLLTHGLTHNAASFVVNQAASPLAFTLADNDYDVWLLNTRGNYHSRMHESLTSADAQFWNFTSEDIAQKDLPAAIDFVKASSGKQKISYVGHSQGALTFMMLLMRKPEYNQSVNVAALLNPGGGKLTLGPGYFKYYMSQRTQALYEYLGWNYIGDKPSLGLPRFFARFPSLAEKLYASRFDVSLNGDKARHLPVYVTHFSGGTSLKNFKYLKQLNDRKDPRFFAFDYGAQENLAVYGSKTPPVYDYSQIKAKLAIFGSKHDIIITPKDTEALLLNLPKEQVVYVNQNMPLDHFGVLASKENGYQREVLEVFREHS
mmetsp:Transcript_8101/g.15943  ORF Transcript_8101/g.15943 Transcript_8101/m.15943 type:complete len:393 (+) Transcript_8101:1275-2453(+)